MVTEDTSNCACGTSCAAPELPPSRAHKCPGCKKPIHAICGVPTGSDDITYSNRCFLCNDKLKKPPTAATANTEQGTPAASLPKKKAPTRKKSSSKLKPVKVIPPTKTKDRFLNQQVAFDLDGEHKATWLEPDVLKYGESINSTTYLVGTIYKKDSGNKSCQYYWVDWNSTNIKSTKIDIHTLIEGISTAKDLASKKNDGDTPLDLDKSVITALTSTIETHEKGDHIESDAEDEDEEDESKPDQTTTTKSHAVLLEELHFQSLESPSSVDENGLTWKFNGSLAPPHQATTKAKASLRPNAVQKFSSPLKSFLAFFPVEFWKLYLHRSNAYARFRIQQDIDTGKPAKKWNEITLDEFMTFFGILIKMTLRPMPGRRYIDCWDEPGWHPYTKWMARSRFTAIRSVLHMSEKGPAEDQSTDTLYKVRPLLNTLKATIGSYLIPGSDLALDEASVAARSKYGRHLIFYNNTTPGGKYHFRFYVVCDSQTYACLRLRVHTKDLSDFGDGPPNQNDTPQQVEGTISKSPGTNTHDGVNDDDDDEDNTTQEPVLVSLVLDMFKPWFNSGKVANMDNYYTSPTAFLKLQENGVLARGTCKTNRKLFPQSVVFSKSDVKRVSRGTTKVAVCNDKTLVAMGWVDGNPVHFLTTADGTNQSTVQRRVNSSRETVRAPKSVVNYNANMQAVDRLDQLVALFSLAKRHQFKKYYNKLTMGLMDFGMSNAEIHYFLANPEEKEPSNHRYLYRDTLADDLFQTDWTSTSYSANPIFGNGDEATMTPTKPKPSIASPKKVSCSPIAVSQFIRKSKDGHGTTYEGMCCQICVYEGRGRLSRHVVFCTHGVRACTINHVEHIPKTPLAKKLRESLDGTEGWLCPNMNATCSEKLHKFYIPKGLFGVSPRASWTETDLPATLSLACKSAPYIAKTEWLQKNGLMSPRKRGRKRKNVTNDKH